MIDFAVREEERLLEDAARRFGDERLRPGERTHEAGRGYPDALRAHHAALGFATMTLPEAAGGSGLSLGVAARAWERLAGADPAAPIALGVAGIASLARSRAGADLARTQRPGAIAVIDDLRALERAEPRDALDPREPREPRDALDPREPGDPIVVAWAPCPRPEWLAIIAPEGVVLATELALEPIAGAPCGLRAAGATRIVVRKPPHDVIGDAAESARWLVELRVFAAACMLGAARDSAAYARRYARERTAFGRPIAHHQGLAFELVDAATELDGAGLLLEAAAAGEDPAEVAAAHALVTETALRVAERSLQVLGGHGYLHDHPVEKRMRDIRALASLYGGAAASERDAAEGVLSLADPLELPR